MWQYFKKPIQDRAKEICKNKRINNKRKYTDRWTEEIENEFQQ